jgi:competence protein ComEA
VLDRAGGILPGTELGGLNLARKVTDGELVTVPPTGAGMGAAGQEDPGGASAGTSNPGAGVAPGGLVNLNSATAAELDSLPGVGPVLAQRILEYRQSKGGFRSVDQLREVSGIGDSTFAKLQNRVTV